MGVVEDLADALAKDAIEAAEKLGDDNLIRDLSDVLEAASTTTQEAFMTAIRVRLAAARGRKFLDDRIRAAQAAQTTKPGTPG
ncbi:hypothetical protein [Actibacterium sp. D379-3]